MSEIVSPAFSGKRGETRRSTFASVYFCAIGDWAATIFS
ncbi:hypothetical protein ACPOL_6118 [Acidisarcina polymorpha]|uniref:Uncharacterized protein n=1 Tax=Acidisarcina polymorpha TaxID=2211140 RepID=A0A2Z5G7W1_9BACT|nr:hypothetical protein ACPOL_6118 [Acidisarcina polymorpha]